MPKQHRLSSYLLFPTLNSTKYARPTVVNAQRQLTLHLLFRQRTEPSKFRVTSQSSKESSSLRRRELPKNHNLAQRRTLFASSPTTTAVSELHQNASSSPCAHQASALLDQLLDQLHMQKSSSLTSHNELSTWKTAAYSRLLALSPHCFNTLILLLRY